MGLRIGTWNLDHARSATHDGARLDLLHAADADIWVLTETNDRVAPGDYTPIHSAPRPAAATGGRWVTIWSRLPVRQRLTVSDPSRTAAALLETPIGQTIVYGTVLPWHADVGDFPAEPPPRAWQEQYRVIPEQGEEWRALRAAYPQAALCVAGDLNMSLGGPRYYGTSRGRELLRVAMAGAGLACTTAFDRVPTGALQHPAIGHILLTVELASAAHVARAWEGRQSGAPRLSDHSGLVVEVSQDARGRPGAST